MALGQDRPAVREWTWVLPLGIAAVAFAARLLSALHSGGLAAIFGYDEGVYFAASTSWVSGLQPYRDFVLVHPPGSVVFLSPFALLGKATSEPTGWMIARLAVMALGALNAALIFLIARRVNLVAGLVAGGLYAVWGPLIHVERTTMLEVFVLSGIVVALWALEQPRVSTARLLLAGAMLGLGMSTKLWGAVPLAVIVGWLLISRAWRSAAIVAGTALVAFAVVVLPFLLRAPEQMYDLVVLAQIGRGRGGTHTDDRLVQMFGLGLDKFIRDPRYGITIGIAVLALVLVAMGIAWAAVPRARVWVALLVVQIAVLLVVPVYFEGYSSFIGPALLLVCGTATGVLWAAAASRRAPLAGVLRAGLVMGVVAVAGFSAYHGLRQPVDLKPHTLALAKHTRDARCVGSDSAGLLIAANVLTRNIERGCPTVVDFDGMIYSFDDGNNPHRLTSTKRRLQSADYQQFMRDYFSTHDVLLIRRAKADAMDKQTRELLLARPRLFKQHGLRVFG